MGMTAQIMGWIMMQMVVMMIVMMMLFMLLVVIIMTPMLMMVRSVDDVNDGDGDGGDLK